MHHSEDCVVNPGCACIAQDQNGFCIRSVVCARAECEGAEERKGVLHGHPTHTRGEHLTLFKRFYSKVVKLDCFS